MNGITTSNGSAVAGANQGNFFESYGEQVSQKTIVGTLLKFSKGDYLAGEHNELIQAGTQLIANMDQLIVGWIRWQGGKPTDQVMGAITSGYQAPKRNTLGDTDEDRWELDEATQKPRDPWQFSNYLVLKEPGEDGELYTFATSSRGGLNAIGELCKVYGHASRTKPNNYPIVALKVDGYNHPNKAYGRIKIPVLDVIGWAPKSEFKAAGDSGDEHADTVESPPIQPASSTGRAPRGSGDYSPTGATKF